MARKVLFLTFHGFSAHSGISKKMLAQIEGLRQCGYEVRVCSYDFDSRGHRCRFIDDEVLQDYGRSWYSPFLNRIAYGAIVDYCRREGIAAVYARSFHNANPWTVSLFRRLKEAGVACVMEVPTYPYDSEYAGFPWDVRLGVFIDQLFRRRLAKHLRGIVTFSAATEIFGAPTIRISNGVDFSQLPLRTVTATTPGEVHLLGVAEVHYWHGYDRVLTGMRDYYATRPSRKVHFHLVGGIAPDAKEEFEALIREGALEPYVHLYGHLSGEALEERFRQADFAIGSLGRHRSFIDRIKTLKNREYAARGIPFVYSETDDDFEQMPYILKAPADDTPLDIARLLAFHDACDCTPQEIRSSVQHLSWKEQMRLVMKEIGV
ncbi:MAG: glycosyltransferase family 1 protein [Bacteroidaceae bacterium]|nr:glycosyltransferase family 1 protein [Bacteroidaceae bacterium]